MLFIIIPLCLILALVIYGSKFKSRYTLTLIFGKKGAGKSTAMVAMMIKDLKKGYHVYTDIQDCILPGVRIINGDDVGDFVPEANSSIYLDEAGIRFDNRNFKNLKPSVRDFFKFQRKYKVKIVMNSQANDIDIKLRNLTDQLFLANNFLGCMVLLRPIRRSITLTDPMGESDSRIADKLSWGSLFSWKIYWLPKYFKYFDSFAAPSKPQIDFTQIPPRKIKKALKHD